MRAIIIYEPLEFRKLIDILNKNNKALFIFGFVFYFIGDLVTTYLTLGSRLPENFSIMVFIKVIFYTALYFLIEYLEKRDNYLCGAILGLVAGMGMTVTR